ncbi:YbaB/EbfC DNA-binding family protein [Nocardia tenerifensis]|uniref:YbaB/EbfC DNA-binding family protein n=1 Tax=Nocardia tenerifensis TaxID=228006 RepID=A0A318K2K2_9NOCA|nr:YbaB/EbfC family nucleoid-associated protein [Nocardia tenerifensis]PXX61714.1 YbaB/EbfC DNA-binding family protein [Nocardia tenerifensis]
MDDDFASAVTEFQAKMARVAQVQAECAQLTATGWAQRRRVRVTVNADGIAVDIKFTAGVKDLTYDEIAEAVTKASQQAVLEIAERARELVAPIAIDRGAAPGLEDMLRAVGSLGEHLH